ncbi:MAG: type II secretion system F family protein [Planctomycetaceae bacterium]
MSTDGNTQRQTTWDDRRLFQDFRGILAGDFSNLPRPLPEELPIHPDDLALGPATAAVAQLLPETERRQELQRKTLMAAGYRSRAAWINLAAVRFFLAFFALTMLGALLIVAPPVFEPYVIGAIVLVPLFLWALPPLVVTFRASERTEDIERGLPDVMDMLNMGVSQGLTLPVALKRVVSEITAVHPALASELLLVSQQTEVSSLTNAMRNFGQRIESQEVSAFTSLLIQAETTGTSVSRALTDYSDSMRASLKERADSRANAASFQLLFPVSLCLMPSVFLFLMGPAIVQISDFYGTRSAELAQGREEALRVIDTEPLPAGPVSQGGRQ